jgi:hypothetical protein
MSSKVRLRVDCMTCSIARAGATRAPSVGKPRAARHASGRAGDFRPATRLPPGRG